MKAFKYEMLMGNYRLNYAVVIIQDLIIKRSYIVYVYSYISFIIMEYNIIILYNLPINHTSTHQ